LVVAASAVFGEDVVPVVVGVDAPASALVVDAAVAIAAAAIESGPPELLGVDGELARPVVTGITTATGFCTSRVGSTAVAPALASVDWLGSVELLSACEVLLLFELSDLVLLPLACVAELLPSLLLLPLFAVGCELPGSLLLLAGGSFGWFWLAAEEACELLLLDVFRLADELSLAERCGGGGGGGSCAGGSRFEEAEGRLLLTSEAKLLASCEASGRAALSAALSAALGGAL
jgi:hypothetical protein